MYQYKAVLISNKQIITEGHTLEEIEKFIVGWKRKNNDKSNEKIEIIHVFRSNKQSWESKEELIKIV